MERVLSQDERIRRAEEIYVKRRMQANCRTSATVNVEETKSSKTNRKLAKQFVICIIIYISFYAMKSVPNFVPQEIMYKIADILEYDINLQGLYENINSYINRDTQQDKEKKIEETLSASDSEGTLEEAIVNESQENATIEEKEDENITPVEEQKNTETLSAEEANLTPEQIDAQYIKANYVIMKPLDGEITSRFGWRNPETPTVPKNHTGIDIARVTGTVILAAMEGDVDLVSSQGDYGNHIKITNGEVSTLYAHCSKIYVKEGEHIVQGQQIAEVGATGNVTGPHLHFEIRRNNKCIDPDLILDF